MTTKLIARGDLVLHVDETGRILDACTIDETGSLHAQPELVEEPEEVAVTGIESAGLLLAVVGLPVFLFIVILGTVLLHVVFP